MKAEQTLLNYSGLVLGIADCISLQRHHKTSSVKLSYILEQINKLKKDSYARESVSGHFNFELDVSLLEKLAVDLKDGRQFLEHLEDDISQLHMSLPSIRVSFNY